MTSFDAISRLAIAELTLYILYLPIAIFILYRHGKRGILGWTFFIIFIVLRITSASFQISNGIQESNGKPITSTASIINSIGVSPMLMTLSGILSEA
jgi:hypothetical protein